jgi:hypothetical protein
VRSSRPFVNLRRLLDEDRRRRRLHHEGEALVRKRRDHHRDRQAGLDTLRLRVERLAELHDVQAALAQRRPDRGRRIGFTRWHLQLDKADDLLCHIGFLPGSNARSLD